MLGANKLGDCNPASTCCGLYLAGPTPDLHAKRWHVLHGLRATGIRALHSKVTSCGMERGLSVPSALLGGTALLVFHTILTVQAHSWFLENTAYQILLVILTSYP